MARWQRPTLDTKFHIDMEWWERSGLDFRLYLYEQLCKECRERFPTHLGTENVDWIDPETGEVEQADALWQCLHTFCAGKADYIHSGLPLAAAVFRAFLITDNRPMSPRELHEYITWKSPELILRALTSPHVQLGIRPYRGEEDTRQVKAAA